MYQNIRVEKTNVLMPSKKDKNKMIPSMLDVYDIYDQRTMKSIIEKDELRGDDIKYKKKKVEIIDNQNIKYYKHLLRKTIDQIDLFGNGNLISIEYLTLEGWKSVGEAQPKANYRAVMATPQTDRGVPSGNYNNAIEEDEPILMARINVFNA